MVEPVDRRSGTGEKPTEPSKTEPAVEKKPEAEQSRQAGAQADYADASAREQSHLPQPDMHLLMEMFFTQALYAMGGIPGVPESEQKVDLNLAQFQIGLLELLQQKTKGNLTEIEAKFLDEYLHQARLAYVSIARKQGAQA